VSVLLGLLIAAGFGQDGHFQAVGCVFQLISTTLFAVKGHGIRSIRHLFNIFPAGATVGEVLDDFFANGTWENYEQDGVTFVHYSGECVSTQTGEKATVGIYFKLNDDGSFEIDRMFRTAAFSSSTCSAEIFSGYRMAITCDSRTLLKTFWGF